MPDIPKGAILQRDKETYAIVPRTPVGMLRPEDLEALALASEKVQRSIDGKDIRKVIVVPDRLVNIVT